ncbi:hypothetical protein THASP1DRAFT_24018 [Thamnocephalis sphaerospora]|uniref:Uncharacterized protein n=1 Tax=Thamnocephalis sphaerospora TaxID=78915 RepID=A0A4P9XPJ2_9FUNG|nr:hypothetical protein THASP1DRAFT_24018 [Thamnocephalis sphaerospora]|eukprot:RKP07908.1 hypothetical protein THASP1DRAFT_24018 [Thamnocephalis sphaerospora]
MTTHSTSFRAGSPSLYATVLDVPISISARCRQFDAARLPPVNKALIDALANLPEVDFSLERAVIEAAEAFVHEQQAWKEAEEARLARERAELQRRAPGLDVEGRILQPTRTGLAASQHSTHGETLQLSEVDLRALEKDLMAPRTTTLPAAISSSAPTPTNADTLQPTPRVSSASTAAAHVESVAMLPEPLPSIPTNTEAYANTALSLAPPQTRYQHAHAHSWTPMTAAEFDRRSPYTTSSHIPSLPAIAAAGGNVLPAQGLYSEQVAEPRPASIPVTEPAVDPFAPLPKLAYPETTASSTAAEPFDALSYFRDSAATPHVGHTRTASDSLTINMEGAPEVRTAAITKNLDNDGNGDMGESVKELPSPSPSPPSLPSAVALNGACDPATRCEAELACFLSPAIDAHGLVISFRAPSDASCQVANTTRGFRLTAALPTGNSAARPVNTLRWPQYANGPLAGLGAACIRAPIPQNETLRNWISNRSQIYLPSVSNCVPEAYCEPDAANNDASPAAQLFASGHCMPLKEDRRRCAGVNQYSVSAGYSVCTPSDGLVRDPAYRATHVSIWILLAAALLLMLAAIIHAHRKRCDNQYQQRRVTEAIARMHVSEMHAKQRDGSITDSQTLRDSEAGTMPEIIYMLIPWPYAP